MSELDPTGAHADDCIADFMLTGQSAEWLNMGGSWPSDIGPGIEDYFTYSGYTATAEMYAWAAFTWIEFMNEIDAGRPVILGVDSSGSGWADHAIIGIGYDMTTHQYGCYDTWDTSIHWYDFQGVGDVFGISDAIFVAVA